MGFDMMLSRDGTAIMTMNWLRNPFGLARWLEDNISRPENDDLESINAICNRWTYDDSHKIDRELFLKVVLSYKDGVKNLSSGFYYFNLSEYRSFLEPKIHSIEKEIGCLGPEIKGLRYMPDGRLKIPMEVYGQSFSNIGHYKQWFEELLEFAELLQDKSLAFYCDN